MLFAEHLSKIAHDRNSIVPGGISFVSILDQTRGEFRVQASTMKYFFHLEDGECIRDPKGEEFPDDAAALLEAAIVARELSKARVHAYEWSVVVQNADGVRIGSVPLVPSAATDAQDPPGLMQ